MLGAGGDYLFGLSLAPDGRQLVYPAAKAGVVSLWLHDLRTGEARALPGTDGGAAPFWSRGRLDGSASSPSGQLRVLDLASGTVSDARRRRIGARRGVERCRRSRVRAVANGGLMRHASRGSIAPFTTLDRPAAKPSHAWPSFLPDGQHVMFLVSAIAAIARWHLDRVAR